MIAKQLQFNRFENSSFGCRLAMIRPLNPNGTKAMEVNDWPGDLNGFGTGESLDLKKCPENFSDLGFACFGKQ